MCNQGDYVVTLVVVRNLSVSRISSLPQPLSLLLLPLALLGLPVIIWQRRGGSGRRLRL